MTREEFEAFMKGEQWTPEQKARFERFTPMSDAETFKREMARPDGIIEVRPV